MNKYNRPILISLLENDAYKFYMQQAIFHKYYDVTISAKFYCRTNDLLGIYINDINEQIEMMCNLKISEEEISYLYNSSIFRRDYLNWLRQFRFHYNQVKVQNHYGKLVIYITGPWIETILWEVPLLAIISEIFHRNQSPKITSIDAINNLKKKLSYFYRTSKSVDISNFKLIDFGTRRRFSRKIQFDIISELKKECPYFIGTSNYLIAKKYNILPFGTQAHEWFQAHQQISSNLSNSQNSALISWLDEYPDKLGIAVTDCITMDAFLNDFTPTLANAYQGLRHDSGDPIKWGEKAIKHYKKLGIDPLEKTLVFSDNLNFNSALELYKYFFGRINVIFGIGTRLTCDIPSVKPLNIVIKLIKCNGKPVAKLSDSPGKSIYYDKKFVHSLYEAFNIPIIYRNIS